MGIERSEPHRLIRSESHHPAALVTVLVPVCMLLGILIWRIPSGPAVPVADLYHVQTGKHRNVVVKIDERHHFPDGTIRVGLLLREPDGFEMWFPRDNLPKAEIVERTAGKQTEPRQR